MIKSFRGWTQVFAGVAAAALALPASAAAVQFTGDGAAYMGRVRNVMPAPAGTPVQVVLGECPGLEERDAVLKQDVPVDACLITDPVTGAATIYVHNTADRSVAMHEVGHVYDERNLDNKERGLLAPLLVRHATAATWGNCGDVRKLSTSAAVTSYGRCAKERFADAYSACALRQVPEHRAADGGLVLATDLWPYTYGWMPSLKRNRHVCALIKAAASPAV